MHSKRNMFLNDTWFAGFTAVMFITGIIEFILCFTNQSLDHLIVSFVAILGLATYISYKKHDKNVMKGLIGAELMWLLCEEVEYTASIVVTLKDGLMATMGNAYIFYAGLKVVTVIVVLFIFVLHFLINADRNSSPAEVLVNQWLSVFLVVLYVVDLVFGLAIGTTNFSSIILLIFKMFLTLMIVSIESRLDAYRRLREENGWVNPDRR